MKVCIVGASGKLGKYMVQHALDRDYEVVGVCREHSVGKLDAFRGCITVIPGATNDREIVNLMVRAEEAHVASVFGGEYRDYCARTPRFLGLPKR